MGCGAVCATINLKSTKHNNHSKNILNQLYQHLNTNPPLLPENVLTRFSTCLNQSDSVYILEVGSYIASDEQIPQAIKQKWKILLYGLFKDDQTYKKCLGVNIRTQEQRLTANDNKVVANKIAQNINYSQIVDVPQYHSCFQQIQKDLNRTFEFKQETKALFERVLKKISNHFPSMGYTQGVNFVVGFMLILGYSQSDAFWMFVHLAINRKYLLLGLYEDDFPLAAVYTIIFKNLLKRYDYQLYHHIYDVIMLQDSVWIFKWFITYFIYSFPLQTIKFVWDLTIQLGGLGLVFYAVGLVIDLKEELLKLNDACDISEFLQSLKQLDNFNKYLKIDQIVEFAYEIKLQKEDFNGIDALKKSFYKQYFELMRAGLEKEAKSKNTHIDDSTTDSLFIRERTAVHKLHLWYDQLIEERMQFLKKSEEEKNIKIIVPQILREDYQDLQKSIQLLQQKIIQNESIKFTRKMIEENLNSDFIENTSNKFTYESQTIARNQQTPQNQRHRNRNITRPAYDIDEEIGELDCEDSECDQLYISQQYLESRNESQPSQQFSIRMEAQQLRKEQTKPSENLKINLLIAQLQNSRKKTIRECNAKANNIKIATPEIRTGLSLAGQNILNNFSITNSQHSSTSSKNAAVKPRKHKENNISRYSINKNSKVRTQTISHTSHPSNSSQHQSSLDHQTEKDSLSGFSHRQNKKQRFRPDNLVDYLERKTQQDLMINSHGPEPVKANDLSKELTSEIEIFNGEGLFKKKKRVNNRSSVNTNLTEQPKGPVRIESTATWNLKLKHHNTYNEQESIESILQISTFRKTKKCSNALDDLLVQIESVK